MSRVKVVAVDINRVWEAVLGKPADVGVEILVVNAFLMLLTLASDHSSQDSGRTSLASEVVFGGEVECADQVDHRALFNESTQSIVIRWTLSRRELLRVGWYVEPAEPGERATRESHLSPQLPALAVPPIRRRCAIRYDEAFRFLYTSAPFH